MRVRHLAVLGLLLAAWTADAQERQRPREGTLKAGDAAPTFALRDLQDKNTVRLADLRGKPVVLIFGSCT